MQSIASKIENKIVEKGRGKIYFASDFAPLGNSEVIRKTLLRLEQSEMLIRIARGIYLYPKVEEALGLGILYPTVEEVAKEIAGRDKARIVPTGLYALNALDLSTQVPMNVVFLTDGTPRKIRIYKQNILFKHTAPKNLAYKSKLVMLVVAALKEIGKGKVTDEELAKIKEILSHETKENILNDIGLTSAWIQKIITSLI